MPISLTLKQKLSNLARSQSTPGSLSATPSSARRNIFNFPRRGDRTSDESSQDYSNLTIGEGELDDIMQKVIRQSGLDFEYAIYCATVAAANHCGRTRPMSVFFSSSVARLRVADRKPILKRRCYCCRVPRSSNTFLRCPLSACPTIS